MNGIRQNVESPLSKWWTILLCFSWILVLAASSYAQPQVYVGPNVNVFQSPVTPGDPLSRQVEPDIAVSPFNSNRLLSVAIDYRANSSGWCAYAYSSNGGDTWQNRLFKGYPGATGQDQNSPLFGSRKCGDPVAAGGMIPNPNGSGQIAKYFVGGLASTEGSQTKVFVTRLSAPANGIMPVEETTSIVDLGSFGNGEGTDKPSILFVPPGMPGTPSNGFGVVHFAYAIFDGNGDSTKIMYTRSLDGGSTYQAPVKVDFNLHRGNGTTMAVGPNGTLYLAWRAFLDENGIYVVTSSNGGQSWSKPVQVAGGSQFYPYDKVQISSVQSSILSPQAPLPEMNASTRYVSSRSEGFPSIAVARNTAIADRSLDPGKVILVWQENTDSLGRPSAVQVNPQGNPVLGFGPRIVVSASFDGATTWSQGNRRAAVVEGNALEFMPRIVTGGNWAYLHFLDTRIVTVGTDRPLDNVPGVGCCFATGIDRKYHARILQADLSTWGASGLPVWNSSQQVSQYSKSAQTGQIVNRDPLPTPFPGTPPPGVPAADLAADDILNPPNQSEGNPFIGDYIGLVSALQFVLSSSGWRLALEPEDLAARTAFLVWVSTQNVALPNKPDGDWKPYDPANCVNPGTRNTDIIFAPVTAGLVARWSGTLGPIPGTPQEFALHVENNKISVPSSAADGFFRARLVESGGEDWSFLQNSDLNSFDTQILHNSSISRAVYRHSSLPNPIGAGVDIVIEQINAIDGSVVPGGLSTKLSYRVGPLAPTDLSPSGTLHDLDSQILAINTLTGLTGNGAHNVQPSSIQNSSFENSSFENSSFENSSFENAPLSDFTFSLTNTGAITTAVNVTTTLSIGQQLLQCNTDFQLLFYRTYSLWIPQACVYNQPVAPQNQTGEQKHDVIVSNISVDRPNDPTSSFENRQVANSSFENSSFENSSFENSSFENSAIDDSQISNASAYVEPFTTLNYTIRSYTPTGTNGTGLCLYDPNDPTVVAAVSLPQQLNPNQDFTARAATGAIRDFTPPVITHTVSPSPNAAGWNNTKPVTVTFNVSDPGSGIKSVTAGCGTLDPVTRLYTATVTAEGLTTLICTATNNGDPAVATVSTTDSVPVHIDTVPPDTTITEGPANLATIATNSTSFSFTGTDAAPSSGITAFECKLDGGGFSACTNPKTLSNLADGSHTFSVRAVDTAGNIDATPDSRTFTVDTKPPVVTLSIPAATGLNGYFVTSPVAVGVSATDATSKVSSFSCTDNTSPITVGSLNGIGTPTASGSMSVSGEGTHNLVCTATDSAGNSGNDGGSNTGTLKIDTKPPIITITPPAVNGTYVLKQSVAYSCSDPTPGSGLATCSGPANNVLDTATVGSKPYGITATDNAGNSTTLPGTYLVVYNITPLPVTVKSPAQQGSAVPISWQLKDAQGGIISSLSSLTKMESVYNGAANGGCKSSADGTHELLFQQPNGATGNSSFRFISSSQSFQFNWDTTTTTTEPVVTGKGCYTVLLFLNDSSSTKMTTPIQLK